MDYIISLDWLQFRCRGRLVTENCVFECRRLSVASKFFQEVYEYYIDNEKFAVVQYIPKFDHEDKFMSLVKIANRHLYSVALKHNVDAFLESVGLSIVAFSRIDLACDFVRLQNGWTAPTFIKHFVANSVQVKGKFKGALFFETGHELEYQTLQIGRHSSELTAKLYNKTRELSEQKDKPYIREIHKALDNKYNLDVWRFEIKLTAEAMKIVNLETGELVCPANFEWWSPKEWRSLFSSVLNTKFVFFKNTGKAVKAREEIIRLFDLTGVTYKTSVHDLSSDTSLKHLLFAKMLYNLDKEMRLCTKEAVPIIKDLAILYLREHGILRNNSDQFLQAGNYHFE